MRESEYDRGTAWEDYRETDRDACTWGMLCHLSALAGYVFPLGWLIGPLVVWLIKRDEYEFVDDQGKESLNFQLTMFLLGLLCIPLIFVGIGIVLLPLLALFELIFTIVGLGKASDGVWYRYPLNFRLIR